MKKTWLLFLTAFLSLLFSCPSSNQQTSESTPEIDGIFRLNMSGEVSSLDPAFADNQANTWAANQLYNGLVRLDESLNIIPCLAKSWEISEDGLSYQFLLRDDVWFHRSEVFSQGSRKVNANDVAFSFQRLLDSDLAADGSWVFNGVVAANDIRAINDSTVEIRLGKRFAPLLSRLSMPYCSVIPQEAIDFYGREFRNHPVGTGPFQLKSWEEGEHLILKKNPDYFLKDSRNRTLPLLEGVHFSFNASKGTEWLRFESGELDFVSDLDATLIDKVLNESGSLRPEYESSINLIKGPYFNTEYLGFDLSSLGENNPLARIAVRQAINLGFDRERMLTYLRNGKGNAATGGMVPPSLLGLKKGRYGYKYDPDRAQKLLYDAGFPGGEGLPEITLKVNEQYRDLCAFIQSQLSEIGIPVRMELVDGKVLRELMVKGEAPFFRASWIVDYPDAESFLSLFYGENSVPPNYTRFSDPQFDRWYEEAVAETDEVKRQGLYRQMDSLVISQSPIIPLYYDEVYLFSKTYVSGLQSNPMNMLMLENVEKIPPAQPDSEIESDDRSDS
jgi:peptide/nickel transport system substrate-binding protein